MSKSLDLSDINDVKKLSISLNNFFKEKGIQEIKQSLVLEALAQSLGYTNWNTFSALNKESEELTWDYNDYIHIDNGGYTIKYNINKELLEISTSFFGYSGDSHRFNITQKGIAEWKKSIDFLVKNSENEEQEDELNSYPFCQEGSVSCGIGAWYVFIKNKYTEVSMYHHPDKISKALSTIVNLSTNLSKNKLSTSANKESISINVSQTKKSKKEIEPNAFFIMEQANEEKDLKEDWGYKKLLLDNNFKKIIKDKDSVTANMAIRYRHDIGIISEKLREHTYHQMEVLMFHFSLDKTDEEIVALSSNINIDKITLKQVREEYQYQLEKMAMNKIWSQNELTANNHELFKKACYKKNRELLIYFYEQYIKYDLEPIAWKIIEKSFSIMTYSEDYELAYYMETKAILDKKHQDNMQTQLKNKLK